MSDPIYIVARGSVMRPGMKGLIQRGAILDGDFSPTDIKSMLADKRIVLAEQASALPNEPTSIVATAGPWSHDPAGLEGKGLDELLLMVVDTDGEVDTDEIDSIDAAVAQLTKNWDPRFSEVLANASDRTDVVPAGQMPSSTNASIEDARRAAGAEE